MGWDSKEVSGKTPQFLCSSTRTFGSDPLLISSFPSEPAHTLLLCQGTHHTQTWTLRAPHNSPVLLQTITPQSGHSRDHLTSCKSGERLEEPQCESSRGHRVWGLRRHVVCPPNSSTFRQKATSSIYS